MRIWRLTPIDTNDRNWDASIYKGEVIVRAPNERIARSAASLSFAIATRIIPGEEIKFTPWRHADLVKAEPMKDGPWPAHGPISIFDPEGHDEALKGVNVADHG